MMHPDTILQPVSDAVGVGVFARHRIPRGTITWVRDPLDLTLAHDVVVSLDPLRRAVFDRYAWREQDDWILCWDHARYVNHSCDANCLGLGVDYEIALRDIEAGEQLTDDYRSLGDFEDPFECPCGSAFCTGWVTPGPDTELRRRWRDHFEGAWRLVGAVEQPLSLYLPVPVGSSAVAL
jgi:hypothetical protein